MCGRAAFVQIGNRELRSLRPTRRKNYEKYAKKLLKVCANKPASFEVFADNSKDMIKQGLKIKKWGKNVYVKIPITNRKSY